MVSLDREKPEGGGSHDTLDAASNRLVRVGQRDRSPGRHQRHLDGCGHTRPGDSRAIARQAGTPADYSPENAEPRLRLLFRELCHLPRHVHARDGAPLLRGDHRRQGP